MDAQALQLHDKVQKLIEQYTLDKQKLAELEKKLNEKNEEILKYQDQLKKIQHDNLADQNSVNKLNAEISELKKKNAELEKLVNAVEDFAGDLNSKIDNLIPKIEKL